MAAFFVDPNNAGAHIDTAELRQMTTAATVSSDKPAGYIIISHGVGRIYSSLLHWKNTLVARDPDLHDKIFAIEGELIDNRGHVVEVDRTVFSIPGASVVVPTADAILAAITGDANIVKMGPYAAGDDNTNTLKARRICPVPHSLVGLFLAMEAVTWQDYFARIYPLIVTEGKEVVYAPLTNAFRALSVGDPDARSAAINVSRPAPPARSATLTQDYGEILKRLFPSLRTDGAAAQQSDIAAKLGDLAAAQNTRFEAQQLAKEVKEATSVAQWLGDDRLEALLNMTLCASEKDLVTARPLYSKLADAKEASRLGLLQAAIDSLLDKRNMEDFSCMVTLAMYRNFTSMKWDAVSPDSLNTGVLGNPFLFGPRDEEATNNLNARAVSLMGGKTAASDRDTQAILKMVVIPPVGHESIDHLKRMEIVATVLLPLGHPFLTWLRTHIKKFGNFSYAWEALLMSDTTFQHAKGIVHLQYVKIRLSRYWREQRRSLVPADLERPEKMLDRIRDQDTAWAPAMSHAARESLGLQALSRMGIPAWQKANPPPPLTAPTAPLTAPGSTVPGLISAGGTRPGGSVGSLSQFGTYSVAQLTQMLKTAKGDPKEKVPTKNMWFRSDLFGEIRDRVVAGKKVASRAVRDMISAKKLPPLPVSKVDGGPMCLAWHTKEMCNPGQCPREADHVEYSVEEYAPLCEWCRVNYPSE